MFNDHNIAYHIMNRISSSININAQVYIPAFKCTVDPDWENVSQCNWWYQL